MSTSTVSVSYQRIGKAVICVFTKMFLLLMILLGFVELIRTMILHPSGFKSDLSCWNRISEIEDRIQKIDVLVMKINKMVQLQFDIVDKKIGVVAKSIEKHAADGLGRTDYALASAGAVVVTYSEPLFPTTYNWLYNWLKIKRVNERAQKMLEPSFGEPGHCFPLQGSNGFVHIKLIRAIIPDAVTLEHVAESVAYDRSSAPKDCQIFGWFQGLDADQSSQAAKMFLLAEFTYDLERSNLQTFRVDSLNSGIVNMIRLQFSSNHGGPHTCIYRLRVHGHQPEA